MRKLRNDQARRYALGAQGFIEGRADGRVDVRHFRKVLERVGLIQLDSVNVFSPRSLHALLLPDRALRHGGVGRLAMGLR
jgi:uncharacterized protein YcaQ